MIIGKSVFDQPVKYYIRTYFNDRTFARGQGDDILTSFQLDEPYFKEK